MSRVKFYINGDHHALIPIAMYELLLQGYECVADLEEADFVLADCSGVVYDKPTILLSSDSSYSDRDHLTKVLPKGQMKEEDPAFVPSVLDKHAGRIIKGIQAEHSFTQIDSPTLVLRVFPVYGPRVSSGLVHQYMSNPTIRLFYPGYQIRTFLHEDDFVYMFTRLVDRFVNNQITGIYNIGSTEEISLKNLAATIKELHTEKVIKSVPAPNAYRWWVIPDMTRTRALTRWRPSCSLRSGIWKLNNQT